VEDQRRRRGERIRKEEGEMTEKSSSWEKQMFACIQTCVGEQAERIRKV
jgi:hypothetical protein